MWDEALADDEWPFDTAATRFDLSSRGAEVALIVSQPAQCPKYVATRRTTVAVELLSTRRAAPGDRHAGG